MLKKNKDKKHAKRLRNDWGAISPVTKIIPNKKKARRREKYPERGSYGD